MTARVLYRIAAVVLVAFAAGHTMGFLTFRPPSTEGVAVYESMSDVRFQFAGAMHTYAQFYTGFGLTVTAYMLFSAFLAWHLGSQANVQPRATSSLAWAFAAAQIVCLVLGAVYFFLVPIVFSTVVVVCLVWAAWLVGRDGDRAVT